MTMRIDVFSDTICPWCFIGKRRLERALEARPELEAEVFWHAFQLNPDMPGEGMDRRSYLETKFGGPERARDIYDRVAAEGSKESIPFAFDAIGRTPNTLESHRLVRWAAGQPGGQDAVVEALFEAYFVNGEDVGDRDKLVEVAARAGLDAEAARAFLASGEARSEVEQEDLRARMAGITGVPCFIVDGKVAIPGAVEPDIFFQVFDRLADDAAKPPPPADAQ
ncbi:MAG: DsbA family oxidoreductase [Gammaproteobacteria bacterium]|nr:DsbA family oxidoreductase [Gammaproteobacteria bacterium]